MATSSPSLNPEQLLAQARAAYNALRLQEALAGYRALVAAQPDHFDALVGLARTLSRMRQQQEAQEVAAKCVEIAPQRFEGHAMQGVLYFLVDRFDDATQALQRALALAPGDPEPHLTLAQVYADQRRFAEAQEEAEKGRALCDALTEPPRRQMLALAWHAQAYVYLAQGRNADVTTAAQEVIALADANPHAACLAYSNLGILEARARHYDQAIAHLEQAYQMNPHFGRAGEALGRLLILRNQPARAVEVLEQVMASGPGPNAQNRFAYAMALAKTGRRPEALEQYRLALAGGLRSTDQLIARWQLIWLSSKGRLAVLLLGVAVLAVLVWRFGQNTQVWTFLILLALILGLQWTLGKRKRQ
jgi:tetratricopeptide (TPR) repeat protein